MNSKSFSCLTAALLVGAFCHSALAQEPTPPRAAPDYKLLTLIGRCADVKCLNALRGQVRDSKLAKIVFYEKWILLERSKVAAEGLLRNMPESESEQLQMTTLADWHEGATESKEDMASLAEIYETWPRSVADAAMVFPQYLPEYLRYGLLAPNDIHSNYTGNEERVCRADRAGFQAAFDRLDRKAQAYLRKYVFDPEKCRAIFIGESD
jgi:hypothetical protein